MRFLSLLSPLLLLPPSSLRDPVLIGDPLLQIACGRRKQRDDRLSVNIVCGQDTRSEYYPWQVNIAVKSPQIDDLSWSSGVLIDELHVLTSAHCFDYSSDPSNFRAFLGLTYLGDILESGGSVVKRTIRSIIIHPGYRKKKKFQGNDIAIIKLKKMVTISDYLRPACLPTNDDLYKPGQEVWVAGIGANSTRIDPKGQLFLDFPNQLQQARLTLESRSSCRWDHLGGEVRPERDVICALAVPGDRCSGDQATVYPSPCRGDSGTGLMATLRGPCSACCQQWSVIGIHSFSPERCGWKSQTRSMTAYISTIHHIDWIFAVIRKLKISRNRNKTPKKRKNHKKEKDLFEFECNSVQYGRVCCNKKTCYLHCAPGWVPDTAMIARAKVSERGNSLEWDPPVSSLRCVAAVAMVVGGFGLENQENQGGVFYPGQDWRSWSSQIPEIPEDLSSVEVYSPGGGCNRRLAGLPSPRSNLVVDLVDGNLVACGGEQDSSEEAEIGRQCWAYHPRIDTWTDINNMEQRRKHASSASVLGKLFVTGGFWQNGESINSTEIWSAGRWQRGEDISPARDGHCSVTFNNISIISSGGWMVETSVQMLTVTSGTWTNMADLPPGAGRRNHGCAMINSTHMMIAGGTGAGDVGDLRSSWILDVLSDLWIQVGDLSSPRHQASLVNVAGEVLAMGGYTKHKYWAEVERYDPGNKTWTKLRDKLITKRRGQAVTAVPSTWFNFFLNGCNIP